MYENKRRKGCDTARIVKKEEVKHGFSRFRVHLTEFIGKRKWYDIVQSMHTNVLLLRFS